MLNLSAKLMLKLSTHLPSSPLPLSYSKKTAQGSAMHGTPHTKQLLCTLL